MKLVSRYNDLSAHIALTDRPAKVKCPELLLWNEELATKLKIAVPAQQRAWIFSGTQVDESVEPVALGYSGHQFGQFSPRLGDGRAHLLGAVRDADANLWDIQLKGSGATPFSRGGDGRCAIGPAIREYIMSEAMAALGVPTTRCLAVVATGETVYRQAPQAGAVVTRVASSHIRVGSFQYLATQGDIDGLKALTEYAIATHYPAIASQGEQRYVDFLTAVLDKQIILMIEWMRVGFIHGVMNTDNTLISGETIDYGPCAMLNQFDLETVFSSIDRQGRYAFGNQANIANWNCARLAESLISLFKDDEQAIAMLSPVINAYGDKFNSAFSTMWRQKLGLQSEQDGDQELVAELLQLLKEHQLDYTNSFNALTESLRGQFEIPQQLQAWSQKWLTRTNDNSYEVMRAANPAVIARNHNIEIILKDYEEHGSSEKLQEFLAVLNNPYNYTQANEEWYQAPVDGDKHYKTYCGT